MPKRKNVSFYACAAAAEEAGFRPCMRCRPETLPGTPAWAGTSATVARALRLIADGALDGDGIDPLAERLGVGGRHLRRLFATHLGASPLAVARTRRVHFARKLIDETDLPLGEIALSSGFRSVRRFNDAMQATFHKAPSALRRTTQTRSGGAIRLVLPYRAPFDWMEVLAWLLPRAIAGVEEVTATTYRRAFRTREGGIGILEVRPIEKAPQLELMLEAPPGADLIELVERTRRLFDLDADPARIARHLRRDPLLRPAVRPGLRVPGAWDGFELAVRAILGQQISVGGATTLAARIVRAFGEPLASPSGALTHVFPSPATLAAADVRSIGMPSARADAIRALADAVARGTLRFTTPRALDEEIANLCALPGVGPWTAQYIAMRAFGEPDAFPLGDLALRKSWELLGGAPGGLADHAPTWSPWRAYAAMTLWTYLKTASKKEGGG